MASSFAEAFRRHVLPSLVPRIEYKALQVRHEVCDFNTAVIEVWAFAWRRGASRLPEWIDEELRDWIAESLCKTIVDLDADDTYQIGLRIITEEARRRGYPTS